MEFRTKLDYSDNRQIKQRERTETTLSGATVFGMPFSALTSGPNLSVTAQTSQFFGVTSTYSGNSATTIFSWGIANVSIIDPYISALTPSNSGVSQNIGAVFASSSSTVIDGNTVNLTYSGVSAANLYAITMSEPTPGNYTGTVSTDFFIYSAESLDFTGRTIWIDNTEILRTKKLIVSNNPQVGYVLTCSDSEGQATWQPSSGGTSGTTYWSASTGTNAIVPIFSNSLASGVNSLAEGYKTTAGGAYSHSEGFMTSATTAHAHAEGRYTRATNQSSHAEGEGSRASGMYSHAEGWYTVSSDDSSHAEGRGSTASGMYSHSEGSGTTAIGVASHAEGKGSVVGINGFYSHAEGQHTFAKGDANHAEGYKTTSDSTGAHAEGYQTTASGTSAHSEGGYTLASASFSHAEGYATVSSGLYSHVEGYNSVASGNGSHAEGSGTTASNTAAHSEGYGTIASGQFSHAGGYQSTASGKASFIHSSASTVTGNRSVVIGGYNITGSANDTVYVPDLVIDGLTSTDPIATDSNGKIVAGTSDIRLKKNINSLTNALETIKNLRGVSFEFTEESNMGEGIRFGFIAQEVQNIIPDIVRTRSKGDGMLNLNYTEIIPLIVEAIKDLTNPKTSNSELILETQTIAAEDNNIELNYNGNHNTAIGGGITIIKGINENENSEFKINSNGDWVTNTALIPSSLVIPTYTPTSSYDVYGKNGEITMDENYLYIKTDGGWKRSSLELF